MYVWLTNLCLAVATVENPANEPFSVNHGAYGPMHIRRMCLQDVNEYAHTSHQLEDFIDNMPLSIWAFEQYGLRYHCKTPADFVRNWHRGTTKAELEDYTTRVMNTYRSQQLERKAQQHD